MTQHSASQIDTLIELGIEYSFTNEDSCLILAKKAVAVSSKRSNSSLHAKALLALGDAYRIFGQLEEGEALLKQGKKLYEALGDEGQVATANNKLGALQKNRGDNEAAIAYYLQALETWENLQDSQNMIKPYINIGTAFRSMNRPGKAAAYDDKALILADLLKDDRAKMYVLNNQALIYHTTAKDYLLRADTLPARDQLFRDSAQYFLEKAINNHMISLALAKTMKDRISEVRGLMNMANIRITQGQYQASLALSREAELISKDLGAVVQLVNNKYNMTKAYRQLGQWEMALEQAKAAWQLATENHLEGNRAEADDQLYLIYRELGQYEKALTHREGYWAYIQKSGNLERNKAIEEIETRYQTVKKEKLILELETNNASMKRQRNYLFSGVSILGILGLMGFQLQKTRRERNDKRAFAEALIFAQEEERKRIARDLHDGIGQSLLLIKKQMESTHETSLENQQMISETLEEVRSISRDLHPFQLEKFGLTAAIQDVIFKVEKSTDLFVSTEIINIDGLLSANTEINVFRVIQEALNNIVKHAAASAAKISIQPTGNEVRITVQDNGKGFDHEIALVTSKSLGLRTMYERIASIGGKLKIEPGSPRGTHIEIRIPQIKKG